MTAQTRHAAGYVLYRTTDEGRFFLLLRNARHGTWGFPKGHCDGDESLETTANRELEEETGLSDIRLDPDFRYETEYEVRDPKRGRYRKVVTYFLAELNSGRLQLSKEHDTARWLDLQEARKTIQWEDTRAILMAAHEHLRPQ